MTNLIMMPQAITILQPYAHLITHGDKRVENRGWKPTDLRGPLLIHAGKSKELVVEAEDPVNMVYGAIVGICHLERVIPMRMINERRLESAYRWLIDHEHCHGPLCWVLTGVMRFQLPIPCRGAQALWVPPADLLPAIEREVDRAIPVNPKE